MLEIAESRISAALGEECDAALRRWAVEMVASMDLASYRAQAEAAFGFEVRERLREIELPVHIVHGENDNDVPIAEAEQFYIAPKDVGVETVMVRYPREGHGLREIGHQVDVMNRCVAWYRKHFQ